MRVLVLRFSALGDVAMTVPVLDGVARRYPELQLVMVSRPFVEPLFRRLPPNVRFVGVDLKQYDGLRGLWRLFGLLRRDGYQAVADLHDVLRTKVLRTLFRLSGVRTAHINKDRAGRKALTRSHHKRKVQQKTSFEKYAEVFRQLGWGINPSRLSFRSVYGEGRGDLGALPDDLTHGGKREPWIGIAPFAAHKGKMLPIEETKRLIDLIVEHSQARVFLFGGGKQEQATLEAWAKGRESRVASVAGRLRLDGELCLMSRLDAMVSMDSANMHLASLVDTPVVSVWGATHPYAGFMGWGQTEERVVQVDLPCRPCSVFGNKPCRRADYACLTRLKAEDVLRQIDKFL